MFQLRRCRRSDEPHFRFYTTLHPVLSTAIAWTRACYMQGCAADEGLHLCISHRNRRSINSLRQEAFAAGKATLVVPAHDGEAAYNLCTGTPLVGCCTGGRGFVNGAFYTVQDVSVCSQLQVLDKLTGVIISCGLDVLAKHSSLAHAVVFHRAQGLSISDQRVILHDFQSPWFRRAHLYVGLSRVTDDRISG